MTNLSKKSHKNSQTSESKWKRYQTNEKMSQSRVKT